MTEKLGRRHEDVALAANLLKRLANPARLAIVSRLRLGEMTVADMEAELGLRQPSLSQQLAELRAGGIVEARREAKSAIYRLTDERTAELIDLLDRLFGPVSPREVLSKKLVLAPVTREPRVGAAVFATVGPRPDAPADRADEI